MKRNMELIRKILLAVEDAPGGRALDKIMINGYADDEVGYHSYLVVEAGLATGIYISTRQSTFPEYGFLYLTWAGHEFLDAARDDTRWKQAMRLVVEKGGAVTLGVLQGVLVGLMKSALGLP